jgi:DNA gyrase/topoisomerase IV subunit A
MAGFNQCVFVGRVGIDPELKQTSVGVSYCRLRLAVDQGKNKTRQPGEEHLTGLARALDIPVKFLVLRRLPNDLSPNEQNELEEKWKESWNKGKSQPPDLAYSVTKEQASVLAEEDNKAFIFGSPVPSPKREYLNEENEEAELQQVLAQLEELQIQIKKLQSKVKKLIARKGRKH